MSFVHDLQLDHDPRLPAFRTLQGGQASPTRRDGDDAPNLPTPAAVDDRLKAAVNGPSLVGFVGGLSAAQKCDVLNSMQLAQRAACAQFDRIHATRDWYGRFVEILERLGWLGDAFAFTERQSTAGDFSLDKSALEIIQSVATDSQLAILVKTLDVLKRLGTGERALKIFELQALAEASGNFQIGAAQASENGAVSLALGAFHFTAAEDRKGALFCKWGAQEIRFWTAAGRMTLNADLYAVHRVAVMQRLKSDADGYVAALTIA